MIKLMKCRCVDGIRVRKNGTFTFGKVYWGRVSKNGDVMMLSDEGQWIKVWESKMTRAFQPILNFHLLHYKFVGNKKEMKELIKN